MGFFCCQVYDIFVKTLFTQSDFPGHKLLAGLQRGNILLINWTLIMPDKTSGLIESKLLDTLMVGIKKESFDKVNFENINRCQKRRSNLPSMQSFKRHSHRACNLSTTEKKIAERLQRSRQNFKKIAASLVIKISRSLSF